eukprot:4498379-Pyramimonas_sp.AAC.2
MKGLLAACRAFSTAWRASALLWLRPTLTSRYTLTHAMPPLQTPLRWEMMARPSSGAACLPSRPNGPSPKCWGAICARPPVPRKPKP